MRRTIAALGATACTAGILVLAPVTAAEASGPYRFTNCAQLNRKFPHGVGKPGAKDKTSGKPVTNFTRSTAWYNKNSGKDRDHDNIACEKR